MAESAASSVSAAGGRYSECEKAQRSKSLISGTANRYAGASAKIQLIYADMAESADALASGASGSNPVEVQVLLSAPNR